LLAKGPLLLAKGRRSWLLQGRELGLSQHQSFLGALGFERLEPLGHGLQVVALATRNARRREAKSALPQLVSDAQLAEGRLLKGKRDNGVLDLLR
jgi:hypothetical protein